MKKSNNKYLTFSNSDESGKPCANAKEVNVTTATISNHLLTSSWIVMSGATKGHKE